MTPLSPDRLEEIAAELAYEAAQGRKEAAHQDNSPVFLLAADSSDELAAMLRAGAAAWRAKDAAYQERDRLVAALSKVFPSWIGRHIGDPWDDDWRWIVFVQLPTGQCSWHIHDSELAWFDHLPRSGDPWDGHTTEEKYQRLAALGAEGER